MSETYASWGRATPPVSRRPVTTGRAGDPFPPIRSAAGLLPRGNGRSYGDSCLNDAGLLVDRRASAAIRSLDAATGLLVADAGVTLAAITRAAAPLGWFLPVTPGTQFVTLGGAVANDVHGKNHHRRGTLGCAVEALTLRRSDRSQPLVCTRRDHPELFAATIGGMGLTGLIDEITLRLMPVSSTAIVQTTTRFDRLDDYFAMAEAADARHEYAVAWIDSLATGRRFGRGHLIAGDHAAAGEREGIARPPLAGIPFTPPVSPLKGLALRAFNEAYFRKERAGAHTRPVAFDGFFYPLDRIGGWNRLYGPRGLHQHQSVVPFDGAREAIAAMMQCARAHGQGSFLTVLKRFGEIESPGLLSFPRPGYTLTLDFPNMGDRTLRLLDALDAITVEAGGAVNPYKDARMSPQTFARSFPNWAALERLRDPALMSDFWRRTAGRLTVPDAARAAA